MAEVTLQLSRDGRYRTTAEFEDGGGITLRYERLKMLGPWQTLNIVYLDGEAWTELQRVAKAKEEKRG